eukprot:TRINITY_DN459_c0_g1_i1.p1 TRINITY_DN459_c0_g1~~TRINITY_DN459_c0_g1_i1.p1  ORF type:complete len:243 (+),score=122.50 TRINITY_DN459_c0_g1_i1:160-888(+)
MDQQQRLQQLVLYFDSDTTTIHKINLDLTCEDDTHKGSKSAETIVIKMEGVNTAPSFDTDAPAEVQNVDLATVVADAVILNTLAASDPENDILRFTIQSQDHDWFVIASDTGVISIKNSLPTDWNIDDTNDVVIRVQDGAGLYVETTMTAKIIDSKPLIITGVELKIPENLSTSTALIGSAGADSKITVGDDDASDITCSLALTPTDACFDASDVRTDCPANFIDKFSVVDTSSVANAWDIT